jgi:MGT family glycosyltransferase
MAKFVFIVPPLTGHINPTLSIGAALLESGHEVAWISLDSGLESRLPNGGKLLHIQYTANDLEEKESEQYLDVITKKTVYGVDSIKFLYEEVLIPLNRHSYKGITCWLDEFKPDLIITDHELFAGAIAAIKYNIPYVTSVTAPAAVQIMDELPKVYEWEQNQIVGLQTELGLTIGKSVASSDLLNLVFTSKEFFGEVRLPDHYQFVGPVIHKREGKTNFGWEKLHEAPGRNKILVSIGTTFNHEHKKNFFAKVIEAFGRGPYTVVVVCDPLLFEHWPDNFIVQLNIPQLEVLPYLDAVVCHGGHNTVCESLTNGLPLVVIPIAYDQSHVASRVVKTGAGLRLNFNRFKAIHLKEAVQEILENPSFKNAAALLKSSFTTAGGTAAAVDLLVNLTEGKNNSIKKMSKFLFVVPPFFGHISPTLSVGASLIARGHEVKWLGITPLAAEHIPPGGEYIFPEGDLAAYQEELQQILRRQDDGPKCSAPEIMKIAFEETYVPMARIMMKGLIKAVDAWKPDLIINDCVTFAGALCAHMKGIPCVTTTPVPPEVMGNTAQNAPKIFSWHEKLFRGLQEEFGLCSEHLLIHSMKMNIVFTSREFAGVTDPLPHMKFVGPVKGRPNHAAFDWDRLEKANGPIVFVSLGTLLVDIRKDFFGKLIDAFADAPLTIVAATDPSIFESWPDNFIVSSFVPQSKLMPKMDVVICHGGFNTVNDTFMNGLPMLIIPITYDHFHTAKLIENAGCGIKIRYKRLRIADMRAAVFELLENPVYKNASARIRKTFIAAGGNDKAVELLEEFSVMEQAL